MDLNNKVSKIQKYLLDKDFIIPSNLLYGGIQNLWDYGHIGVLLKNNILDAWKRFFVEIHLNVFWVDCAQLGSGKVWEASGHLSGFHDMLVDCKKCKKRFREDHLLNKICPNCGHSTFTSPREFNLMFKTDDYYLRPETAQNIFINFPTILKWNGCALPVGGAQIGKSFRNEVTVGNGIFRMREFTQMELEWFCDKKDADEIFDQVLKQMNLFLSHLLHISPNCLRDQIKEDGDRAHYSSKGVDIEFKFPHGWGELWGLANRSDYDLSAHSKHSKKDMSINGQIPWVVEHSLGLDRLVYAVICHFYYEEEVNEKTRIVLKLPNHLAPYKMAILPLTKHEVHITLWLTQHLLKANLSVTHDIKGSIGKRYRKQDAIGTAMCISVDQDHGIVGEVNRDTIDNLQLTIRDRDTMKQHRMTYKDFIEKQIHEAIASK